MSQLIRPLNESRSDYTYFDISSYNASETEQQGASFRYTEDRNSPFLDGPPEAYEMSIIRFSIDTDSPVFIPQIVSNQPDRDKTVYVMSIESLEGGVYVKYSQPVQWIAENQSVQAPTQPDQNTSKEADYSSGYYDCASYNYLMYLLTVTSKQLMAQLAVPEQNPVFKWNESDDTMSILFPETFTETVSIGGGGEPVLSQPQFKLYFNIPLFQLFNTLPAIFKGYNQTFGVTQEFNYYIPSKNILDTNRYVTSGGAVHYETKQESTTEAILSPFSCLVFTSNTLPIIASNVSPPQRFVNGRLIVQGSGNDTQNIITDIRTSSNVYSPNVLYEPASEYRWVSLMGNTKLYKLDIQVYYRLKTGNLYPVQLKNGSNFNMKIVFRKK
tara:strand:- start:495 stop:1646 length:1152 start_codon:yes stop_codon:yes gene_type:complete